MEENADSMSIMVLELCRVMGIDYGVITIWSDRRGAAHIQSRQDLIVHQ
jgi:hypothetical protein